jgi:hypothetical protein
MFFDASLREKACLWNEVCSCDLISEHFNLLVFGRTSDICLRFRNTAYANHQMRKLVQQAKRSSGQGVLSIYGNNRELIRRYCKP